MSLDPAKLETMLRAGDTAAIIKFFRGANEAGRKALAPAVKSWCQRLERNWRAQFDRKAKEQIKKEGPLGLWPALMPSAYLAALASLNLKQIESIHLVDRPEPALIAEVLRDRRPDWLDEFAEAICHRDLHSWTGKDWKLVRHLVREGLCRPPRHDAYVLGAIHGLEPRSDWRENLQRKNAGLPPLPKPEMVDLLLAERDWLETAFWRLFELEGTSEVSLANGAKYARGEGWTTAIAELSRRGVLSRERLLDASLAALARDFIQFRAGWYSRFHEELAPTPAEREKRLPAYFQLLGSSIPPTVTFALKAIQALDKEKPIPGAKLAPHLESSLSARSKTAVTGALQLLERAARREPAFAETAARSATLALLHESPEVQAKAFDFLEKHGRATDAELRAKVSAVAGHIAPSLRKRLTPWTGEAPAPAAKPEIAPPAAFTPPPARLDPARALKPIADLNELILAASAVLESPENPLEIERVLDGLSRLAGERPADFDRLTGPLRKRALKKRDDEPAGDRSTSRLDRALAMLMLTWTDDQDGFTEDAVTLGRGQNHFAFLFRRLHALGDLLRGRNHLPLLSVPTHEGGWIDPRRLVDRWLAWQQAGAEPELHDQVLALLRLAPEERAAALTRAGSLRGEAGDALRFALGAAGRTGKNAALWLAAWRSRQPGGDLPEFEKVHPGLGPDAGPAARYKWQLNGQRCQVEDSSWTRLESSLTTAPVVPGKPANALLPVLFHGQWEAIPDNEKNLLRWAATLWPANREAFFAQGFKHLALAVNYADAGDRDVCAYLEPLAAPHTEMRPMATLALALGLAAEDAALRGHAQEGLIAAIAQGRLDVPALAAVMAHLLGAGVNKFARWGKSLREAARVSSLHAVQVAGLLRQSLRGDPARAPRDLHVLLELLIELLAETGGSLNDPAAGDFLRGITTGGRTAKLVKQLLGP